jgi:hypothetical protein
VQQVQQVLLEQQVPKDHKEFRVFKEVQDQKDPKVRKVFRVLKDPQA